MGAMNDRLFGINPRAVWPPTVRLPGGKARGYSTGLGVAQGLLVPILWKEHLPESDPQPEGRAFHLLKSTAMATAST
jgi:hypothetical protein